MMSTHSRKPIYAPPRLSEVCSVSKVFETVLVQVKMTIGLSSPFKTASSLLPLSTPFSFGQCLMWMMSFVVVVFFLFVPEGSVSVPKVPQHFKLSILPGGSLRCGTYFSQ